MAVEKFYKDPDATLDYVVDWNEWLDGDTISDMDYIADDGITVETGRCSFDTATSTLWLSGGTAGQTYDVVCRVTTALGRVDDRTIRFTIKER